jgi:hypothetical protein
MFSRAWLTGAASAGAVMAGAVMFALCQTPVRNPGRNRAQGALFSNWASYDASFAAKVRMAASNTFLKLRKHQACCGNNGQPGC